MTKQKRLPGWSAYWAQYTDLAQLKKRYDNLDDTLHLLEKEFQCKLLSGDHVQIITGLEDRIDELEQIYQAQGAGLQAELF